MAYTRLLRLVNHLTADKEGEGPAGLSFGTDKICRNQVAGIRMGSGVSVKEIIRRVQAWHRYVNEVVPNKIKRIEAEQRPPPKSSEDPWTKEQYDVVVLGYGAAGASAALEAADNGMKVLLVDRFEGGGSTRRSGGIYYAGGGTRAQKEAGIEDSVENMFKYIKYENDGAVDDETIMEFCRQSPSIFEWLETRVGVPFRNEEGKTVYYQKKTSYPPSYATLYQSGNESAAPYKNIAKPAARGNRPFGDYLTGNIFFGAFERAVENHPNIVVKANASAMELHIKDNTCVGVSLNYLPNSPEWSDVEAMHNMLHEIGSGSAMFSGRDIDRLCRQREEELFSKFAQVIQVMPKKGVIIACGGFYFNENMIKKYAPKYEGFMPLGNLGDDGSGIRMALKAGVQLERMDRCSAWKFINPPYSFVSGVLVNSLGERVGNEDVYGASFADFLVQNHQSQGWLIIDQKLWDSANHDCLDPDSGLQEDQRMQGLANLHKNFKKADTFEELAKICSFEIPTFIKTISQYNEHAGTEKSDPVFHKDSKFVECINNPPYYAINLNMVGNKYWPTPCMTLGGIKVEGSSGRAIAAQTKEPINKLYAAGRSAVGVASNYYVSGLSLADCVFSGKRAGRHISKQT